MPFADRSFYTNMKYGGKYYTYIAKELPSILMQMLHISPKREDHYIAGLSMGGYGALKIGLRECETFCAAEGLSSGISRAKTERIILYLLPPRSAVQLKRESVSQ